MLPQLIPYFPENINTFVDLFSGGANVGINVKAERICCNDINQVVIDWCNECLNRSSEDLLTELEQIIHKYDLSKTNEEGFKRIRTDYNLGNKTPMMFYAMLTHAFNYQIRFNQKGEYNMPFGRDRSSFNPSLKKKFIEFVDHLKTINITFTNFDYIDLKTHKLKENDFVYADPPYLITTAAYNEQDGWNEKREKELLYVLDYLNLHKVKFALSNVLESKGKTNDILIEWSKKYNVHRLNFNYANSSYHTKDRNKNSTVEVLITNY